MGLMGISLSLSKYTFVYLDTIHNCVSVCCVNISINNIVSRVFYLVCNNTTEYEQSYILKRVILVLKEPPLPSNSHDSQLLEIQY